MEIWKIYFFCARLDERSQNSRFQQNSQGIDWFCWQCPYSSSQILSAKFLGFSDNFPPQTLSLEFSFGPSLDLASILLTIFVIFHSWSLRDIYIPSRRAYAVAKGASEHWSPTESSHACELKPRADPDVLSSTKRAVLYGDHIQVTSVYGGPSTKREGEIYRLVSYHEGIILRGQKVHTNALHHHVLMPSRTTAGRLHSNQENPK